MVGIIRPYWPGSTGFLAGVGFIIFYIVNGFQISERKLSGYPGFPGGVPWLRQFQISLIMY
jgi:hypothetical protein